MTIEAELQDGRILEFPDGTDPRVVDVTVKRVLSGVQEGVAGPIEITPTTPQRPLARGTGEIAAQIATGIPLEVAGGLAGVTQAVNPFAAPGAGQRAVEATRALAFQPGAEGVQAFAQTLGPPTRAVAELIPESVKEFGRDVLGTFSAAEQGALEKFGPLAATAVTVSPLAMLEAIPGFFVIKKLRQVPVDLADEVVEQSGDTLRAQRATVDPSGVAEIESIKAGIPPEAQDIQAVVDSLKKPKAAVEAVRPDAEIRAAAERLGVDLNPDHYSTNAAFIETTQALKSRPGTGGRLVAKEQKAIADTGQAADNLIQDLGGTTDKSLLDVNVRSDIDASINDLTTRAERAYKVVDGPGGVPKGTRVNPTASRSYVNQLVEDFGGGDEGRRLLSPAERDLLQITKIDQPPTYAALDRVRKDVGSGYKNKGPYADDDRARLDQVYKVLSDDQQGVADAFGVGEEYAVGRKLVSTRKDLEGTAKTLFDREVGGSLIPKMTQAVTQLTKGDVSKFRKLMEALPAARRQEAAATMLNSLFNASSRGEKSLGQGFVNAFNALNRNEVAKRELFRHLPPGARKRFDDIGKVATGIFRAKSRENVSRTARDALAALDDGSMLARIFGEAGKTVGAEAATTLVGGIPGLGVGGRVLGRAAAGKGPKNPKTIAADELLASGAFTEAVSSAIRGNATRAERVASQSEPFKRWRKAQPASVRKEIAAIGFIPWLLSGPETDATQNQGTRQQALR